MNELIQDASGDYWLNKPQGLRLACLTDIPRSQSGRSPSRKREHLTDTPKTFGS